MAKATQIQYRVIMEFSEGCIERSLPYLLETKEEAEGLVEALNSLLYPKYKHRVEPSITHHMSENKKERVYAYHGRE